MMRLKIIFCLLIWFQLANSQIVLQDILDSISVNNLQIKASAEKRDAQIVLSRTGINPSDPEVEYGYFPGNRSEIGTKTNLDISQSFYFPTVYAHKRTSASLSGKKSEEIHRYNTRNILFKAALNYIELVYLDKYSAELQKRVEEAENIKTVIDKKNQSGDANQLEINKVQSELLLLSTELKISLAKKAEKEKIITALNGGKPINMTSPEYPWWKLLPLDSIIKKAVENDPLLKTLDYDMKMAETNVKLQQSFWFPQFKAGYGQETILDDTYRGVQAGISIPLWQNKNTVKYARLDRISAGTNVIAYREQLISEINAKYETIATLNSNVEDYQKIIDNLKSEELIKIWLNTGDISVLEYYRELSYWREFYYNYLEMSRDYYIEMLDLMKYTW